MKKIYKILACALAIAMLSGAAMLSASADLEKEPRDAGSETIHVSLRIEGAEALMYYNEAIEIPAGLTVLELMETMDETVETLDISIDTATFGFAYVPEINGLAEFDYGGYSGWMFLVNGVSGNEGIADVVLADRDIVVFYYSDQWGAPGFQFPDTDVSRLISDGVIRFTSEDTDYDEDWNPVTATMPIVGATVGVGTEKYTTDENGEISISDVRGLSGLLPLLIEKYDEESGVPTVLRNAPGYAVYVPFADAPLGAWYDAALEFCVRDKLFIGTSAEENLFRPMDYPIISHLVTVLERIIGTNHPALTPLDWALANKIIDLPWADYEAQFPSDSSHDIGDWFAGEYVNRQQFIYMFYLTVELAGRHDMSGRADITGAIDYDWIYEGYRDAVSWAVASGIIRGTDADTLTINPNVFPTRAEVCQMLLNYYS